jgi:hypothetical protein
MKNVPVDVHEPSENADNRAKKPVVEPVGRGQLAKEKDNVVAAFFRVK